MPALADYHTTFLYLDFVFCSKLASIWTNNQVSIAPCVYSSLHLSRFIFSCFSSSVAFIFFTLWSHQGASLGRFRCVFIKLSYCMGVRIVVIDCWLEFEPTIITFFSLCFRPLWLWMKWTLKYEAQRAFVYATFTPVTANHRRKKTLFSGEFHRWSLKCLRLC